MEKQTFIIQATNDKLWNLTEFVKFLADNQHKDIKLIMNPEAICFEHTGVYHLVDCFQFSSVRMFTKNPLESHTKYSIVNPWKNEFMDHVPVIPTELHTWSGAKKFLAFYHRPTASRLGLASYLFKHYKDQSSIHFNYNTDIDRLQLYEFDKLALLRLDSLEDVAAMLPYMPLYAYENHDVDEIMTWYDYSRDPGITLYRDILVDIISEAHTMGNTFYPTEKTTRPMWLKKPFITFASKDYLCYLRQLGFRTFNDFWDEDYDSYEGRERYVRILQLVDTLAKKSKSELNDLYWAMKYTLDYNYDLLQTQSYNTSITKIT